MSIVRFCGDLHLGHKWMATERGFHDEFYHNEHIIEEWNKIVHKKDTTYILGDITMENKNYYSLLKRLSGRKIVVLGNHDPKQYIKELLKYVNHVAGAVSYKGYMLTHIPIHPSELEFRFKGNIHAHTHMRSLNDYRYIGVSIEYIKYKPITLEEVNKIFEEGKTKKLNS